MAAAAFTVVIIFSFVFALAFDISADGQYILVYAQIDLVLGDTRKFCLKQIGIIPLPDINPETIHQAAVHIRKGAEEWIVHQAASCVGQAVQHTLIGNH